ncbi:MAG: DUF452 family protein [Alphaproteobacteria bacterium]|nr:DUF452 family protein [Alphaproteobacteria bacterium]
MRYFFQNNNSQDLIVFFSGWGCDENQFTNLHDNKNVLILYDYQNLVLDFDFSRYANIYVIAYSAGVFVASITVDAIPNLRQKTAICGNPYLFDEILGLSAQIISVFKNITLDNYLDFRKKYMVYSENEYERYNQLQSLRTLESCNDELEALQKMYEQKKTQINPQFDKAIVAENDLIFNIQAQVDFYKDKLSIIKNARHHIFFHFESFEDILNIK